ncbi:hypothetical protein [Actinotalea sp. Marseille-Q4924]|uniref:restriction system modified-DNA reader domain-containing protein n=1 Tax=Actinotalea sp. Marseille-Q4924 TaxID=2866571 RepID=UPI001CE42430|nr:hypothetical protein [Actinotalea sp. Marseille-Q4924]
MTSHALTPARGFALSAVPSRTAAPRQVSLPGAASRHTRADVGDQLDALLGEHLLPVRTRTPGADEPHLLAVDASGRPVVVEVVGRLDEAACLRALSYAGRAARMSTQQLAAAYSGGAASFEPHLEAFRRTVSPSSLLRPSTGGGARLLVVCTEIAAGVDDVLEFLVQPGHHVEVLRVRVTADPAGGRVVDVVPVDRSVPVHEAAGLRSEDLPVRRRDRREGAAAEPERPRPTVVPPPFAAVRTAPTAPSGPTAPSVSSVVPPSGPLPLGTPVAVVQGLGGAPASTAQRRHGPDPRLTEIAARREGPTRLVWVRRRRGERYEAVLHPDGVVEAHGKRFGDPDRAAAFASGGTVVDGWAVWRAGSEDGPSLRDLLREPHRDGGAGR